MASNLQCVVHNSTIHDPGGMQPLTEEKLEQFLRVKKKRLSQPISSSARMAAICATIPESISPIHGYHTNCAKRFTMNQHRLTVDEPRSTVNTFQHIPRGKSSILFPPKCIFCESGDPIWVNRQRQQLSEFAYGGGKDLAAMAEACGDFKLHRKITDVDLFAVEAKYHRKCERAFRNRSKKYGRSKNEGKLSYVMLSFKFCAMFLMISQPKNLKIEKHNSSTTIITFTLY